MRRLVLVLLGALGLGGTAELLGAVLPLLACGELDSFESDSDTLVRSGTHAAGGKPSRSCRRHRCGPGGSEARTSSGPRRSRRPERSRCSCHHRTVCGTRRRRPGPCWTCTGRPTSHGAHPWRRWGGWGGGRPWKNRDVSRAIIEFELFIPHFSSRFVHVVCGVVWALNLLCANPSIPPQNCRPPG